MVFKICNNCLPRWQKPIGLKRRKCPTCGACGKSAFRSPSQDEINADQERRARHERIMQELLAED